MLSELLLELTGMAMFEGRLFRAGMAALTSIFLVLILMPPYIRYLQNLDATADFDKKDGTKSPPIMGGLLLIIITAISTILFAHLNNYVIATLVIMIAYAIIGGVDDLFKIRNKRLVSKGKLSKTEYMEKADGISSTLRLGLYFAFSIAVSAAAYKFIPELKGYLTLPFVPIDIWRPYLPNWAFIIFMSFVITATANGTNFTDGLDSLVSVPIITSMIFIGGVAYIGGNFIFSQYLNIPYLPGSDELFPFAASIAGALLAYLWFNSPPAEIYMGDSGSIGFGGTIGVMFILIRAELFIPIVCLVIMLEAGSVVLQISWFKFTRKITGSGKRLFLCAPLHHHYQKKWANDFPSKKLLNSKIVWRMHIISIIALIAGFVIFFKLR